MNTPSSVTLVLLLAAAALWAPAESVASGRAQASEPDPVVVSQRLALQALVLGEDASNVAGQSRLRMVHGSELTPTVDIYVTPPGAAIGDPSVTPLFAGVSFGACTELMSLAPGTYDVTLTIAGDTATALHLPALGFNAGDVLTLIASDGGSTDPGLVVIDTNTASSGGVF